MFYDNGFLNEARACQRSTIKTSLERMIYGAIFAKVNMQFLFNQESATPIIVGLSLPWCY